MKRGLWAPLLFLLAAPTRAAQTKVYAAPGDLEGAVFDGARPADFAEGLVELAGGGASSGTVTLAPLPTPLFDSAAASWDADTPPGTSVEVFARIFDFGEWSEWFSFGVWSADGGRSAPSSSDVAWMDLDTLRLKAADHLAAAVQLKAVLRGGQGRSPVLRLLAVATADEKLPLPGEAAASTGAWTRELAVPERSQMSEQADFARDICSPTSLAMVLEFWGVKAATADTAAAVQDRASKRYGDWPFNTAWAAAHGLRAWVARFNSLSELQDAVASGLPVIVSVRFSDGQLSGAPIRGTLGHLMVVRGFTPEGDVIVNDPAAPAADGVRRVYKRAEFRKAWLENHAGPAYMIAPRFPAQFASAAAALDLRAEPQDGGGAMDRGRLSQLIYGEGARVLSAQEGWAEVEAVEQRHFAGGAWGPYKGWVSSKDLITPSPTFYPNAVVVSTQAPALRTLPGGETQTRRLPLGTRVMRLLRPGKALSGQGEGRDAVRLANGAQVSVSTKDIVETPLPDAPARRAQVLAAARSLLGRRYLWGGRSSMQAVAGEGVDCSGLVSLAHRAAGVDVPRDANDLYLAAQRLQRPAEPGDLLFLTKPGDAGVVNHAAIYEGGDALIESVEDGGVRETTFAARFGKPLDGLSSGADVGGRLIYFGTFLK